MTRDDSASFARRPQRGLVCGRLANNANSSDLSARAVRRHDVIKKVLDVIERSCIIPTDVDNLVPK